MQCEFIKADATQCNSRARVGRRFCITHDDSPDSIKARTAGAYRGGRSRAGRPIELGECRTAQEISEALRAVALAIANTEIDAVRGRAIAQALQTQLKAIEIAEELAKARREIERLKKRLGVVE